MLLILGKHEKYNLQVKIKGRMLLKMDEELSIAAANLLTV